MVRPAVVAVAFLLVVAPLAAAGPTPQIPSDQPSVLGTVPAATDTPRNDTPDDSPSETAFGGNVSDEIQENRTVNRLGPGSGPVTVGYLSPGPDLTSAVEMGDRDLEASFVFARHHQRYEAADNDTERRRVLETALDDAERQVERLYAQEAAAVRAYSNGTASKRQLSRDLARLDSQSESLLRALEEFWAQVEFEVRTGTPEDRFIDLRLALRSLESPLRDQVVTSVRGSDPSMQLHVTTGSNGVVLEGVTDIEYFRDTVRFDNRDESAADGFSVSDTTERVTELYPWAFPRAGGTQIDTALQFDLYAIGFNHPHGTTTVYLDGGTRETFREQQRLRLDQLPRENLSETNEGRLTVRIQRTAGVDTGGDNPFRVVVTNDTGAPVDAAVSVAGHSVGRTGEDGSRSFLATPRRFRVTVSTANETINVTIAG